MSERVPLGRSETLELLDEVLHDPRSPLRAVELVGRGIAADARITLLMMSEKARTDYRPVDEAMLGVLANADQMVALSEIVDELVELWRRRCTEDLDDPAFEGGLRQIVVHLERWSPYA